MVFPLGSKYVRHGVIKEVCPLKQAGVPTPCFCIVFDLINLSLIYVKKFQKDLNNNSPHEAIDFMQNSSWKLG